jgi:hypothetical protein
MLLDDPTIVCAFQEGKATHTVVSPVNAHDIQQQF